MIYHYIRYASGNTYIMSEGKDVDGKMMLVVEMCVNIDDPVVAKSIGEQYYPPLNNTGAPYWDIVWVKGDLDEILGIAALEVL